MSQPSSFNEPLFDDAQPTIEGEAPIVAAEAPPQYRKQGFSVYSMLLLLSFLFLLTASIVFFNYTGG